MLTGPRLVCFDVDSTLLAVESLDFALTRKLGPETAEQIEQLTSGGMNGTLSFRQSLISRLDLTTLTRSDIAGAAVALCEHLTPGMSDLLSALRKRGDRVCAISGGFADILRLALRDLGFASSEIFANTFSWDGDKVAGIDVHNPLSDNGGKPRILSVLRQQENYASVWMVGDGVTDLETLTAGAADHFVGFGAIARRDAVVERAPDFADTIGDLQRILLG
ncbi:HAD-IB family phosphatase [Hyphobacterium sp. HN65]|uniref:phosphoserine phosphatase n=1 Tax=Hyphobacterium lacteum TaxID=3116575 RepID=A0ABU7LSH6_9PROT|nr:HAD-IB family phosphatase [Hyphobacterium sp. HN65]MEE2526871.1 HAD-IB family phosphatase [Hyphobacterium sp. HN65]